MRRWSNRLYPVLGYCPGCRLRFRDCGCEFKRPSMGTDLLRSRSWWIAASPPKREGLR
jgi:hypothetical protein